MLIATLVRMKNPLAGRNIYHVRIAETPQTGGEVEVVEIFNQKKGETREQLDRRADGFLKDHAVKFG